MTWRWPLLVGGLAAAAGGCVSEGPVLGDHRLPRLEEVADVTLVAPEDAVVDIVGDLDGDGVSDLIAYATAGPALWIRYSNATGSLGDCTMTFDGPVSVAPAGDVDGDGRADLLVSSASTCRIYLVYGSDALCGAAPAATFVAPCNLLGRGVDDLDGDGVADFVITAGLSGRGAQLFYGRGARFAGDLTDADADAILMPGPNDQEFGLDVAPAGDTDGDGRSDFFITEHVTSILYRGPATRFAGNIPPERAAARFVNDSIGNHQPRGLGDLDGDGRGDFALNGFAALYTIYYGREGSYGIPDAALAGTDNGAAAAAIRSADLDHDGMLGLAIVDPRLLVDGRAVGGVHLLRGGRGRLPRSTSLFDSGVTWVWASRGDAAPELSASITSGDLSGDGLDDLVVAGTPDRRRVYVFFGPLLP